MKNAKRTEGITPTAREIDAARLTAVYALAALSMVRHRLIDARFAVRVAGCRQTLKKIQSAIKSADGARRHLERRRNAAERGELIYPPHRTDLHIRKGRKV